MVSKINFYLHLFYSLIDFEGSLICFWFFAKIPLVKNTPSSTPNNLASDIKLTLPPTVGTNGQILVSDGDSATEANLTWTDLPTSWQWITDNNNIYYNNGKVGIATDNPNYKLFLNCLTVNIITDLSIYMAYSSLNMGLQFDHETTRW